MKVKLKQSLIFSFSLLLFILGNALGQENPHELLQQMGFSTVDQPAIEFSLSDLQGHKKTLKDYKGRWLWLTFWATWCGPCNYEMPVLQSLHEKWEKSGLSIVGVSIDQGESSRPLLKKFVANKSLTFPILHDFNNDVAQAYQAFSVPSLYVISPEGKLVGIFRGANEWGNDALSELMDKLLKIKKVPPLDSLVAGKAGSPGSPGSLGPNGKSLNLPEKLVPPLLEVIRPKKEIELKESFNLEVRVKWKGDPQNYLLQTPRLTVPKDVQVGEVSSYSQNTEKDSELYFVFPITILENGRYELGPLEMAYQSRWGGNLQHTRAKGITLDVGTGGAGGFNIFRGHFIFSLITVLVLVGGAGFLAVYYRRRWQQVQQKAQALELEGKNFQRKREAWDEIQKLKLSSSRKDYLVELLRFSLTLQASQDSQDSQKYKIQKLIEEIQYGGGDLSLQHQHSIEKEVNQRLLPPE